MSDRWQKVENPRNWLCEIPSCTRVATWANENGGRAYVFCDYHARELQMDEITPKVIAGLDFIFALAYQYDPIIPEVKAAREWFEKIKEKREQR